MARPRLGSDVGGFGQVPLWVIQRASGSAVRVFGWLSGRYADRDKIAPPRKLLAAELGVTDPKVIGDALSLLEEIGALVRIEHPGHASELQLCYVRPENRGLDPSEKTEGGRPKKRKAPFRKNGRHKINSLLQESVQERSSEYINPKHHHRYPVFWCGEFFCVSEEQHEKFVQRVKAAGVDAEDLTWPEWYTERDQEWGETDITDREPKGPMFWLAVRVGHDATALARGA